MELFVLLVAIVPIVFAVSLFYGLKPSKSAPPQTPRRISIEEMRRAEESLLASFTSLEVFEGNPLAEPTGKPVASPWVARAASAELPGKSYDRFAPQR